MRKRLLPLIGTLTLACTAVASVSYATDPQPGDTAIQEVEKGDLNTSTDAAATTPLRDTRFYYAHACAENRTGWSFYGDKIAWAAGHWNVARDFTMRSFDYPTYDCLSAVGEPDWLTMRYYREYLPGRPCWRLTDSVIWQSLYYAYNAAVNIYMNTAGSCGVSPINSTVAQNDVSQVMGYVIGCNQFYGGTTTSSAHPNSYSVMNVQRTIISPTELDASATSNSACSNRRY